MPAAASPREVIIRLRGELDESLRDSFAKVAKAAQQSERVRTASARSAASAETRARRDAGREEDREIRESIRRAANREDAIQRHYVMRGRAAQKAAHDEARALASVEMASRRATVARERLMYVASGVAHGGLQIARGGLMLRLLGSEEDTQKFLQTFVKIEAGIAILQGGVQVWRLLSVAVRQYNTLLAATATLETAVTAAQAGRAATTMAANAGGGALAAGAAGAAGAASVPLARRAGGLVRRILGTTARRLTVAGAAGYGIAKYAGTGAGINFFGWMDNALGFNTPAAAAYRSGLETKAASERAQHIGGGLTAMHAQLDQMRAAQREREYRLRDQPFNLTEYQPGAGGAGYIGLGTMQRIMRQAGTPQIAAMRIAELQRLAAQDEQQRQLQGRLSAAAGGQNRAITARDEAQSRYTAARAETTAYMRAGGPASGIEDRKRAESAAFAELERAQERVQDRTRALTEVTLSGQRDKVAALNAELKVRQDIVQGLEQEKKSVTQRFGWASEGEQRRLVELAERARKGGQLNRREWDVLGGFAGPSSDLARLRFEEGERRARRGGASRFFGTSYEQQIQAQLGREREITQQLLEVKQNVEVKLTTDYQSFENQFIDMSRKAFEKYEKRLKEVVQRLLLKQAEEQNNQR